MVTDGDEVDNGATAELRPSGKTDHVDELRRGEEGRWVEKKLQLTTKTSRFSVRSERHWHGGNQRLYPVGAAAALM